MAKWLHPSSGKLALASDSTAATTPPLETPARKGHPRKSGKAGLGDEECLVILYSGVSWPVLPACLSVCLSVCMLFFFFFFFFSMLWIHQSCLSLFFFSHRESILLTDPTLFSCSHFFQVCEYTQFCRVIFSLRMILHRVSAICRVKGKRGDRREL